MPPNLQVEKYRIRLARRCNTTRTQHSRHVICRLPSTTARALAAVYFYMLRLQDAGKLRPLARSFHLGCRGARAAHNNRECVVLQPKVQLGCWSASVLHAASGLCTLDVMLYTTYSAALASVVHLQPRALHKACNSAGTNPTSDVSSSCAQVQQPSARLRPGLQQLPHVVPLDAVAQVVDHVVDASTLRQ